MAIVKTLLRSKLIGGMDPGSALAATNEELYETNDEMMFSTTWVGILNIADGQLTYANAGHNPPLLVRRAGQIQHLRDRHGPPVGPAPDQGFGTSKVVLASQPGRLSMPATECGRPSNPWCGRSWNSRGNPLAQTSSRCWVCSSSATGEARARWSPAVNVGRELSPPEQRAGQNLGQNGCRNLPYRPDSDPVGSGIKASNDAEPPTFWPQNESALNP